MVWISWGKKVLSLLDDKLIMCLLFHFHRLCQYFVHLGKPLKSTGGAKLIRHSASFSVDSGWRPLETAWPKTWKLSPKGPWQVSCYASAWHSMGGQATQSPLVSETMWHYYGTAAVQNQPLYVNYMCLVTLLELYQWATSLFHVFHVAYTHKLGKPSWKVFGCGYLRTHFISPQPTPKKCHLLCNHSFVACLLIVSLHS